MRIWWWILFISLWLLTSMSRAQETSEEISFDIKAFEVEGNTLLSAESLQEVMNDVASTASQLLTQAHLLEEEEKPLQARDILRVAKCLVSTLEHHGLHFYGEIGETTTFDPSTHHLIAVETCMNEGDYVVIRFPGATFRGTIVHRAGVEAQEG